MDKHSEATSLCFTGDQAHKLDSGNKREQQWQPDCDRYTVEHSGGHQPFNAATWMQQPNQESGARNSAKSPAEQGDACTSSSVWQSELLCL